MSELPNIKTIIEKDKRPNFARIEVNYGFDSLLKLEYLLQMYLDLTPSPIPEKYYHDYGNAMITLHELRRYMSKRES